jgi:hypothetical protein
MNIAKDVINIKQKHNSNDKTNRHKLAPKHIKHNLFGRITGSSHNSLI